MSMFATSEKKELEDKAIMGTVKAIKNNSLIIQTEDSSVPSEKEIAFNEETKIYLDQNAEAYENNGISKGAPHLTDKNSFQIDGTVVIGLIGSKNDPYLTAEVIHILPE